MTKHIDEINARIVANGVRWHRCETCGIAWPFPNGPASPDVYSCHVCLDAAYAARARMFAPDAAQRVIDDTP